MRRAVHRPFKARSIEVDGHKFPSQLEARRYGNLKLMQMAGDIRNLEVHPRLPMVINGGKVGRGWYEADFKYERYVDGAWRTVYEDAKPRVDYRDAKIRRQVAELVNGVKIAVVTA